MNGCDIFGKIPVCEFHFHRFLWLIKHDSFSLTSAVNTQKMMNINLILFIINISSSLFVLRQNDGVPMFNVTYSFSMKTLNSL